MHQAMRKKLFRAPLWKIVAAVACCCIGFIRRVSSAVIGTHINTTKKSREKPSSSFASVRRLSKTCQKFETLRTASRLIAVDGGGVSEIF